MFEENLDKIDCILRDDIGKIRKVIRKIITINTIIDIFIFFLKLTALHLEKSLSIGIFSTFKIASFNFWKNTVVFSLIILEKLFDFYYNIYKRISLFSSTVKGIC